jgi:hypothetical protein
MIYSVVPIIDDHALLQRPLRIKAETEEALGFMLGVWLHFLDSIEEQEAVDYHITPKVHNEDNLQYGMMVGYNDPSTYNQFKSLSDWTPEEINAILEKASEEHDFEQHGPVTNTGMNQPSRNSRQVEAIKSLLKALKFGTNLDQIQLNEYRAELNRESQKPPSAERNARIEELQDLINRKGIQGKNFNLPELQVDNADDAREARNRELAAGLEIAQGHIPTDEQLHDIENGDGLGHLVDQIGHHGGGLGIGQKQKLITRLKALKRVYKKMRDMHKEKAPVARRPNKHYKSHSRMAPPKLPFHSSMKYPLLAPKYKRAAPKRMGGVPARHLQEQKERGQSDGGEIRRLLEHAILKDKSEHQHAHIRGMVQEINEDAGAGKIDAVLKKVRGLMSKATPAGAAYIEANLRTETKALIAKEAAKDAETMEAEKEQRVKVLLAEAEERIEQAMNKQLEHQKELARIAEEKQEALYEKIKDQQEAEIKEGGDMETQSAIFRELAELINTEITARREDEAQFDQLRQDAINSQQATNVEMQEIGNLLEQLKETEAEERQAMEIVRQRQYEIMEQGVQTEEDKPKLRDTKDSKSQTISPKKRVIPTQTSNKATADSSTQAEKMSTANSSTQAEKMSTANSSTQAEEVEKIEAGVQAVQEMEQLKNKAMEISKTFSAKRKMISDNLKRINLKRVGENRAEDDTGEPAKLRTRSDEEPQLIINNPVIVEPHAITIEEGPVEEEDIANMLASIEDNIAEYDDDVEKSKAAAEPEPIPEKPKGHYNKADLLGIVESLKGTVKNRGKPYDRDRDFDERKPITIQWNAYNWDEVEQQIRTLLRQGHTVGNVRASINKFYNPKKASGLRKKMSSYLATKYYSRARPYSRMAIDKRMGNKFDDVKDAIKEQAANNDWHFLYSDFIL